VNFWQVQIAWAGLSHTSGTINLYSYTASVPTLVASSTGVVFDGAVVVTIDDDGNNLLITANGKSVANASTLWAGQTTQDIAFVDALNSGGWSVEYLKVEPIPP
jgi:selenophosphate synthetase-related protein